VLDYHAPGRHLLLDGVVTTIYKNTRQRKTGKISGYAAKLVEDMKFYANRASYRPVAKIHGGVHSLVPFAVEMLADLGHIRRLSFDRSLSGLIVKAGGAAPRPAILVGTSSGAMGPPMYPYGF